MPGGDRTGPLGNGPMTGRGAGPCADNSVPAYMDRAGGRGGGGSGFGRGRGFGGGRGRCRGYGWAGRNFGGYGCPPPSRDVELSMLRDHATNTEGALDDLRKRIAELERDPGDKE